MTAVATTAVAVQKSQLWLGRGETAQRQNRLLWVSRAPPARPYASSLSYLIHDNSTAQ